MEPEDRIPPLQPVEPVERVDQVDRVEYVRPGERVVSTARYETLPPWYRAERIIYFILGIVETFLVIRLILKLLAASLLTSPALASKPPRYAFTSLDFAGATSTRSFNVCFAAVQRITGVRARTGCARKSASIVQPRASCPNIRSRMTGSGP